MADDQDERPSDDARGLRRQLEEAQAALAAQKAEFESFKQAQVREQAFAKAGIPESPLGKMFVKAYDGELTAEAIKSAALEAGLIQQQRATPDAERGQFMALQDDTPALRSDDGTFLKNTSDTVNKMFDQGVDTDEIMDYLRANKLA